MSDQNIKDSNVLNDKSFEIVPSKEKLSYAFAQLPGTFYGAVMGLIQSFWYGWMGLQVFWITIAQVIYAIWNMVNDPLFGNVIGNTRFHTKKGEVQRYIPYIKYLAPIFSVCFAVVFFPPDAWRGNPEMTIQVWMFVWYLVSQLAYDTLFTLVLCAHVALLPQMTLNQREREKVQFLCAAFSLPAILIGFLLPVVFLSDPNPQSIASFQILVIGIAIFGVFPYWLLAKYVHEHAEHIPEKTTGIIQSFRWAFKNPSYIVYVIYDGVSVFIINMLIVSLPFYITWVLVPLGVKGTNMLLFWLGPIICLLISIKIELWISAKYSTKAALTYYHAILAIGFFVMFFAGLIGNWVLISVGLSIMMLGFSGDFLLHNPMRSETIDYEEWKISGERREGVYAGIGPILSKPSISLALALPTLLMTVFGLIYVKKEGGLYPTQGMAMASLGLNISMALIPGIVALVGLIIWVKYYPITGEIAKEMKQELAIIHEKKHKEYVESHRESVN